MRQVLMQVNTFKGKTDVQMTFGSSGPVIFFSACLRVGQVPLVTLLIVFMMHKKCCRCSFQNYTIMFDRVSNAQGHLKHIHHISNYLNFYYN